MKIRSSFALAALFLLGLGQTTFILAAPLYWDGTDTGANANGGAGTWTTGTANWDTAATGGADAAWTSSPADAANFGTPGGAVVIDAAGVSAASITLSSSGYSFSGGTLTLNGALTTSATVALANPTVLGAAQTWTDSLAGSEITINGSITNSGYLLTLAGSGNFRLNGALSGTGGLTKSSTGVLYAWGTQNHSGTTTVSAGYLELSGGALTMPNSVLNLTSTDTRGVDIWAGKLTVRGLTGTGNIASNGSYNNPVANWWWTLSTDKVGLSINVPTGETYTWSGLLKNATWASSVLTVEKTGPGTEVFSTGQSFSGTLYVNGGTLRASYLSTTAGTSTALGLKSASRSVVVNAGGTLEFGINNVLGGSGASAASLPTITVAGGTLRTTRFNILGNLVLNGGTLTNANATDPTNYDGFQFIGSVTVGGTSASTLNTTTTRTNHLRGGATTTFTVANATSDTNADLIVALPLKDGCTDYAGAGSLLKDGPGTMRLAAANTYTGTTTVNAGTLEVAGSLASAVTVNNGGTLAVPTGGSVNTISVATGGTFDTKGSTFTLGTGRTLGAGRATSPATDVSGNLATAAGGFLRPGATAGAAATMTVSGSLTLGGGTLSMDMSNDPNTGNDSVVVGGILDLSAPTNIAINPTGGSLGNGTYILATALGGITGPVSNVTYTGVVAGGRQALTLSTTTVPNTLTLDVTGTVADLVWNNGASNNQWSTAPADANWLHGAVADFFYDGDRVTFPDTANFIETVSVAGTVAPLAINATNTAATMYLLGGTGRITGPTTLTAATGGRLQLGNTGGNDFTGATSVTNASTLIVGAANALSPASTLTVNGSTLDVSGVPDAAAGPVVLQNNAVLAGPGGSLAATSLTTQGAVISAGLSGPGSLTVNNNSALQLLAPAAHSGGTTVAGGSTLEIGDGGSITGLAGAFANEGTLRVTSSGTTTISLPVSGAGAIQQNGTGTTTLAGACTYRGTTSVNAGVLDLATNNGRLYTDAYRTTVVSVAAGATLKVNAINYDAAKNLGQLTHNSPSNVLNGGRLEVTGAGETCGRGWTINAPGGTLAFTNPAATFTWQNDTNWCQIDLANGATATFEVAGRLNLNMIVMDYTGTPGVNGGASATTGGLVKTGPGILAIGSLPGPNVNYPGAHPGYTQLYTGPTVIQEGTLALTGTGSIANSSTIDVRAGATFDGSALASFTLASGKTVKGNGTIKGNPSFAGIVAPGASTGTLTVDGSATFAAGSTFKVEIDETATPVNDSLAITGSLTITGGTLDFDVTGTLTQSAYVLATYTGSAPAGTFAVVDLPNGYVVNYSYNGNSVALVKNEGYDGWAAAHGINGEAFGADHDQDGLPNGVEYALGLTPTEPSTLPGLVPAGSNFVITFTKGPEAAIDPQIDYGFEISTDLALWTDAAPTYEDATTVSYTLTRTAPARFVRLKIVRTTGP